MATFYKCDKCGKNIKGEAIAFSFDDVNKKFFEKAYRDGYKTISTAICYFSPILRQAGAK